VSRKSKIVNRKSEGFTMMEIAISLAIIGIALVAIIGVLPIGMNVQQDVRQQTIIGQDANVFMEAIRNGSLGLDDLTNYIYAITNYWQEYGPGGTVGTKGVNGYTYSGQLNAPGYPLFGERLTSGANIIGLLSTPEYIGAPASVGSMLQETWPARPYRACFLEGLATTLSLIAVPSVARLMRNRRRTTRFCKGTPLATVCFASTPQLQLTPIGLLMFGLREQHTDHKRQSSIIGLTGAWTCPRVQPLWYPAVSIHHGK
jgi:prepilin-type N-terminal cleavage/methylation domain-containing protein